MGGLVESYGILGGLMGSSVFNGAFYGALWGPIGSFMVSYGVQCVQWGLL